MLVIVAALYFGSDEKPSKDVTPSMVSPTVATEAVDTVPSKAPPVANEAVKPRFVFAPMLPFDAHLHKGMIEFLPIPWAMDGVARIIADSGENPVLVVPLVILKSLTLGDWNNLFNAAAKADIGKFLKATDPIDLGVIANPRFHRRYGDAELIMAIALWTKCNGMYRTQILSLIQRHLTEKEQDRHIVVFDKPGDSYGVNNDATLHEPFEVDQYNLYPDAMDKSGVLSCEPL